MTAAATTSPPDATPTTTATAADGSTTPRRRIVRRRHRKDQTSSSSSNTAFLDPVFLEQLRKASGLPQAYEFEIDKCVMHIQNKTHIALQLPEGLLLYATTLADLFLQTSHTLQQVSILGDVTYGACCIDDIDAHLLGAELLIHYGHSCLVPLQHTKLPCLYVFVEIQIDIPHVIASLQMTLQQEQPQPSHNTPTTLYLLATIQFRHALSYIQKEMKNDPNNSHLTVIIPQVKPLSPGEVLGCTSPRLTHNNNNSRIRCLFIADGRFHLESTLISNPHLPFLWRYDPYSKHMTVETYQHADMYRLRKPAIQVQARTYGILLGTLGRQGNPSIVKRIQALLRKHDKQYFLMLLSEITPAKLQLFANSNIDAWVQVACPRLSVDWGHHLGGMSKTPVLSPYELFVSLGETQHWHDSSSANDSETTSNQYYPMDYYSQTGGPWSNYHETNSGRKIEKG